MISFWVIASLLILNCQSQFSDEDGDSNGDMYSDENLDLLSEMNDYIESIETDQNDNSVDDEKILRFKRNVDRFREVMKRVVRPKGLNPLLRKPKPSKMSDNLSECAPEKLIQQTMDCMCRPYKTMVEVPMSSDNALGIQHPKCTVLEQCMGSCYNTNKKCIPLAMEIVEVPVMLSNRCEPPMKIEKHTKCGCACKMTADDCTEKQYFIKEACKCDCKIKGSQRVCNDKQRWNPVKCECECKSTGIEVCSNNYKYSMKNCECRSIFDEEFNDI